MEYERRSLTSSRTRGALLLIRQAMGLTPLLAACQNGQLEAVKILLASGADVNHARVKTGRTALMEAAARTNVSIVKELLRYGACTIVVVL